MTTITVTLSDETTSVDVADDAADATGPARYEFGCGTRTLHRTYFSSDPPRPEDLTNAIGAMIDHLDDAVRELNLAATGPATVVVAGEAAWTIAAIEIGASVAEPTFVLSRRAAEDVFRTVATEPRDLRRRNPGLPVDQVDSICASCCAMVAIIRSLHLEEVTVQP